MFADWLEERGDPRALGYRAIARVGAVPHKYGESREWSFSEWGWDNGDDQIPTEWFQIVVEWGEGYLKDRSGWGLVIYKRRRDLEDQTARLFLSLPLLVQKRIMETGK